MMEQARLCAVWPIENWLGSSLNRIQGLNFVRESYSRALEQGSLPAIWRSSPAPPWPSDGGSFSEDKISLSWGRSRKETLGQRCISPRAFFWARNPSSYTSGFLGFSVLLGLMIRRFSQPLKGPILKQNPSTFGWDMKKIGKSSFYHAPLNVDAQMCTFVLVSDFSREDSSIKVL